MEFDAYKFVQLIDVAVKFEQVILLDAYRFTQLISVPVDKFKTVAFNVVHDNVLIDDRLAFASRYINFLGAVLDDDV